jgi:hypothetical protein
MNSARTSCRGPVRSHIIEGWKKRCLFSSLRFQAGGKACGHDASLAPIERDDFSSNRHPALSFCLSMISAQTFRVCREENRYPPRIKCGAGFFRIMLQNLFRSD